MRIAIFFLLALSACLALPDASDSEEDTMQEDDAPLGPRDFSLRGDPNFHPDQLSEEARVWYDRLLVAIENPRQYQNAERTAQSGNMQRYSRVVNMYVTSLLAVFRATGDLRLLDEVDRIAQIMRGELVDHWIDMNDSRIDASTDHMRWLWLGSSSRYYGRDDHVMDSARTHGMIARVAWAFENNRDLESPSGVDYGERADFWKNYLLEHFEPVWRSGSPYTSREWPRPVHSRHGHPFPEIIAYHYYLFKLTGEEVWYENAVSFVDQIYDTIRDEDSLVAGGFVEVETALGSAYVWPHRFPDGAHPNFASTMRAQPTGYSRYVYASMLDLELEGLVRVVEEETVVKMANSLAYFQVDLNGEDIVFYSGVTGDQEVGGIPPASPDGNTMWDARWAVSPPALFAGWDESGTIRTVNQIVYDTIEDDRDNPRRIFVPAGMLIAEILVS